MAVERRVKMISGRFAAVFFAAIFLSAGCAAAAEEKPDHMKLAAEALESGGYERAAEEFRIFIGEQESAEGQGPENKGRRDLNIAQAYRGIGMARFEQGRYAESMEAFEAALERGGENTPALCRFIGICLAKQEKYDEALKYFDEGLKLPAPDAKAAEGVEPQGAQGSQGEKVEKSIEEKHREVRRDLMWFKIDCLEKLYDWKGAYKAAEEYLEEYPDDAEVMKEAEFLSTR